ncbi:hypothetical protein HYW29_00050 [Candidatus Amesbacteria bacterium]|nr:hypothetical protein [Candidatus Amesbacteria bacterium]
MTNFLASCPPNCPGPTPPSGNSGFITNPALDPTVGTGEGLDILQIFITNFITIAFGIGAIVLVFMLISGGVRYIAAGSDKDAVQHAAKQLTHALIGITILLSVYAIIALIGGIFGIDILQINFPTL